MKTNRPSTRVKLTSSIGRCLALTMLVLGFGISLATNGLAYQTQSDCESYEGAGNCCQASDGSWHRQAACNCISVSNSPTSVFYDGFLNVALGNSTLSLESVGILAIHNIGASGQDGVYQDVPNSTQMRTLLASPNFSGSGAGAQMIGEQIGVVDGITNQLFSRLTVDNIGGDQLRMNADFSFVGTSNYTIEIYIQRGGALVTRQTGLSSGVTTMPKVDIHEADCTASPPPLDITYGPDGGGPVAIAIPGRGTFNGGYVKVIAEDNTRVPTAQTRIVMTGRNLGTLRLTSETTTPPPTCPAPTPPSVAFTIVVPTLGPVGTNVTAFVMVQDISGVVQVGFYLDNQLVFQDTASPYTMTFGDLTAGAHSLTAVALSRSGLSGTSAPVILTITNEPGFSYLVRNGSDWKYLDNGSDQGTAWRAPGFDDSAWNSGPAELGYGDSGEDSPRPERTVINGGPATNRIVTTYFRHAFNVPDPGAYSNLVVRLLRDDGGVVYLNGVEVFRSNIEPVNPISFTTLASDAADDGTTYFSSTNLSPALLVAGQNVLAVEIHQSSLTSSDLSFDAMLLARGAANQPPVITQQPQSQTNVIGSNVTFSVTATGTPPLSYQWRFNSTNISGATSTNYTISNAQTNDAGIYNVVVSNAGGSVTSAPANLVMKPFAELQVTATYAGPAGSCCCWDFDLVQVFGAPNNVTYVTAFVPAGVTVCSVAGPGTTTWNPVTQLIRWDIPGGLIPCSGPATTVHACFSGIGAAGTTLTFTGYDSAGNTHLPFLQKAVPIGANGECPSGGTNCVPLCRDFNDNNLHGWTFDPAAPNVGVAVQSGGQGGALDYYVQVSDQAGDSAVMAGSEFNGDWSCLTNKCGQFCYDFRIISDNCPCPGDPACANAVNGHQEIHPAFKLTGCNGKSFTFVWDVFVVTEDGGSNPGWHRIYGPVGPVLNGGLPTSPNGHWVAGPGTSPTAADFCCVLADVQKITISPDYGSCQTEVICIDNVCWTANPNCVEPLCRDFNDNNLHGWKPDPLAPNVGITLGQPGPSGSSSDYYVQVSDQAGASAAMAGSEFYGDWSCYTNCCGEFCYDYQVFSDGCPCPGNPPDSACTNLVGGAQAIAPRFRLFGANGKAFDFWWTYFTVTNRGGPNPGWHRITAPLGPFAAGSLPFSPYGTWTPVGTAIASDWCSVLQNVSKIDFYPDFSRCQTEVIGIDNVCLRYTTNCGRSSINKDFCNMTGQTADCIEIVLAGTYPASAVLGVYSGPYWSGGLPQPNTTFPNFTVTPSGANTILRWSGQPFPPGACAHVGFAVAGAQAQSLAVRWTLGGAVLGCVKQVDIGHMFAVGDNKVTFVNEQSLCPPQVLYVGNVVIEYHVNPVELPQLNASVTNRNPVASYQVPGIFCLPAGAATNVIVPAGPANALWIVALYTVSSSPTLQGPGNTTDFVQMSAEPRPAVPFIDPEGGLTISLTISVSGGNAVILWPGEGILQSATAVTGPWTDVPGATSPYSVSTTDTRRFFRVRLN